MGFCFVFRGQVTDVQWHGGVVATLQRAYLCGRQGPKLSLGGCRIINIHGLLILIFVSSDILKCFAIDRALEAAQGPCLFLS